MAKGEGHMSLLLASIASAIAVIWGIAHLIPTHNVIVGFGDLSKDNRLVITQEWIAEGVTLIFLGILVGVVTVIGWVSSPVVAIVYTLAAAILLIMTMLTALTGARGSVAFFKICPLLKTVTAVLLLISMILH
jgi:hypothetical protein